MLEHSGANVINIQSSEASNKDSYDEKAVEEIELDQIRRYIVL